MIPSTTKTFINGNDAVIRWIYEGPYNGNEVKSDIFQCWKIGAPDFQLSFDNTGVFLYAYVGHSVQPWSDIITLSFGYKSKTICNKTLDITSSSPCIKAKTTAHSATSSTKSFYWPICSSTEITAVLHFERRIEMFLKMNLKSSEQKREVKLPSTNTFEFGREYLCKIYADRTYTDMTIKFGSEEIQAHRMVLCLASPIFRNHFESVPASSTINVDKFSVNIFKIFVDLIYHEICHKSMPEGQIKQLPFQEAIGLFEIVCHYQVAHMQTYLESLILLSLNKENLVEVLASDAPHLSKEILQKCLDIVRNSNLETVVNWNQVRGSRKIMDLLFINLDYISGQKSTITFSKK